MTEATSTDSSARQGAVQQPDASLGQRAADLQSARDSAQGSLLRNLALLAASLVLWIWTYVSAMVSGGGVYIIAFGAGIFGGGNAVNAYIRLRRVKQKLAELEAQYGAGEIDAAVSKWADELLGESETAEPTDAESAAKSAAATKDAMAVGYVLLGLSGAGLIFVAFQGYGLLQAYVASPDEASSLSTWVYALGMGTLLIGLLGFFGVRSIRSAKKSVSDGAERRA